MKPFVATGIRLVIYLDDMVMVSSTREISLEETVFVIHVLESLHTVEITVSLPERKIIRVLTEATCLRCQTQCSVRELAHFIGLVVSSFPANAPARLYYHDQELCKLDALSCCEGN